MSNLYVVSDQDDAPTSDRRVDTLFSSPGFRQRYERAHQSMLDDARDNGGRAKDSKPAS